MCVSSVVDAWGKFPSGIHNLNLFDLGSFTECFRIVRNGQNYKTQYCIAQLIPQSMGQQRNYVNNRPFRPALTIFASGLGIYTGICLPVACSVDQLVDDINRTVHRKFPGITVRIPKDYCQSDEFTSELTILDFIAMWVSYQSLCICSEFRQT